MLINKIKADQLQARKDRKSDSTTLLTTLYSEAAMIGKNDGGRETTDREVCAVIKKFIKNAETILDNLEDDSDERFQTALFEIDMCTQYLPEQLDAIRLEFIIRGIIEAEKLTTVRDMGTIMKVLNSKYAGLFDGKFASQSAKEQLLEVEKNG